MQTYFGKINIHQYPDIDFDECFFHNGNYYWYKLEIEDDQFKVYDTCDRMVPFDFESADEFATMGFVVSKYYGAQREATELFDKRMDQLQQVLDFWETNE